MMTKEQKQRCKKEFFEGVKEGRITQPTEVKEINGYKVGDNVLVKNGNGHIVGPFEILGFDSRDRMYLNWDCYWYTIPVDRIIKVVKDEE